ncbi:hypothetical protein LTR64_002177 [Lithohypha guttulata]|uniref:Uncharacterized protein n=1 Tax=Lithohypha guttulata TaxID=1690604 RepID=A0AAN7YCY8_9EURO|nr:hypothetical protein LTR51_001598 [Lithohypha guttulata]KAK5081013.1 hypothetical protein LTR05_008330 [Lithohypha guttulata]
MDECAAPDPAFASEMGYSILILDSVDQLDDEDEEAINCVSATSLWAFVKTIVRQPNIRVVISYWIRPNWVYPKFDVYELGPLDTHASLEVGLHWLGSHGHSIDLSGREQREILEACVQLALGNSLAIQAMMYMYMKSGRDLKQFYTGVLIGDITLDLPGFTQLVGPNALTRLDKGFSNAWQQGLEVVVESSHLVYGIFWRVMPQDIVPFRLFLLKAVRRSKLFLRDRYVFGTMSTWPEEF